MSPRNDCQGCAWTVKIKTLKGRLIARQFNTEWAEGYGEECRKVHLLLKVAVGKH